MKLSEIIKVLDLKPMSDDREISEWVIDSRRISRPEDAIFVALQGELRDGHSFAQDAYDKGLRYFLLSQNLELPPDAIQLVVPDTLAALQELAKANREMYHGQVIGITGSNGKTIVKEWLGFALSEQYSIYKSPKSYNSQIGVALSILEMDMDTEFAIIESGISESGEMEKLHRMIRPQIAVLSSIGDAHQEGFESVEEKLVEKLKLFRGAEYAYIGAIKSEELKKVVEQQLEDFGVPHTYFVDSEYSFTTTKEGSEVNFGNIQYKLSFSDEASVLNSLLVYTILDSPKFETGEIPQILNRLPKVSMRLEMLEGRNNCKIINDVYSADLHSVKIALASLDMQSKEWKKSAILSELNVSPSKQDAAIKELIELLNRYSFYRIMLIGKDWARHIDQLKADKIQVFATKQEMLADMNFFDFQDEFILIKGARKYELEELVEILKLKKHSVRLEVDLTAMGDNLLHYKSMLRPKTKVMVMVKSQSYGAGYYEIAKYLQVRGVDYMAVTYTDEGVRLRQKGITTPIMVMNPEQDGLVEALDWGLELELYSHKILDETIALAKNKNLKNIPVHIKFDTGMHRLGFAEEDMDALVEKLKSSSFLEIKSSFTHLFAADEKSAETMVDSQVQKFEKFTERLQAEGIKTGWHHVLNSAGVESYPQFQKDMVRLGIGLYGVSPYGDSRIRNVSTLVAEIAQIKHLKKGDYLGYGSQNIMDQDRTTATINIGYADGYQRDFGNGNAFVMIGGQRAETIGNVCMDMFFVDITGLDGIEEGQEVVVFGTQPSLVELAKKAGTISYEIITSISDRVTRVYNVE